MKQTVLFAVDGEYHEITLWDVTTDKDGNVTGTHVIEDFPQHEETVTIAYEHVIAVY